MYYSSAQLEPIEIKARLTNCIEILSNLEHIHSKEYWDRVFAMVKKNRKKKSQSGDRPENGGRQLKASGSNTAVAVNAKSPLFPAPLSASAGSTLGSALPSRRHHNWQPAPDKSSASTTAPFVKVAAGAAGALLTKGVQLNNERPRTAPTVLVKQGHATASRRRNSALDYGAATDIATSGASVGGAPHPAKDVEGGDKAGDAGVMEEYEWARKNHERHQQAAFMQVIVKSFMTEATLLDVLLPMDTTVVKAQCAHHESTC